MTSRQSIILIFLSVIASSPAASAPMATRTTPPSFFRTIAPALFTPRPIRVLSRGVTTLVEGRSQDDVDDDFEECVQDAVLVLAAALGLSGATGPFCIPAGIGGALVALTVYRQSYDACVRQYPPSKAVLDAYWIVNCN